MKSVYRLLFALLFLLPSQLLPQSDSQQPVLHSPIFVFIRMRAGDAINIELTENRLRRVLQLLDSLNKGFPSAHVRATIFVNGAVSQELAERNSKTGMQDLLLDYARKGVIELGYDGADEPRSKLQPLMDYRDVNTPKENYLARVAVAQRVLTEGRDPITGKPLPESDGGLKRMQQVFGEAASIWGTQAFARDLAVGIMPDWGSDAEVVQQIRLINSRATMAGVLDDVPHMDFFYDDWVGPFSKNLSPSSDSSRDLYWQENRLRISERSDKESRVVKASEGADMLKVYLGKLDRSKIRIVQIEIGDDRNFLQARFRQFPAYPPARYAATHPEAPNLPKEAFDNDTEVNAAFQKEQDALEWLLKQIASDNLGAQIASNKDLITMTPPCSGFSLSTASLRKSLGELDKSSADSPVPPKYVEVEGRYLSLAQTFQVLTEALAERHRTGKFPESLEVLDVYGPVELPEGTGLAKGEVSGKAVALAAVYLVPALHEDNWGPIPRNLVPSQVQIGDLTVNGAQYLRLMIKTFLLDDLETKLPVKPSSMVWAPEAVAFRTRPIQDMGTIWTIKPAPIEFPKVATKSQ